MDDGSVSRVYEMLRVLHERGYEQLRIVPGMSPSGMHYRAAITFAANVSAENGALALYAKLTAPHSSADRAKPFAWKDAADADAARLADLFLERFPLIAKRGFGPDPAYVTWFRDEALVAARSGHFPVAYADYELSAAEGCLATTGTQDGIVMPPPGLAPK